MSRYATLDIGGETSPSIPIRIYYAIYQLFLVYQFLIGSPVGDSLQRGMLAPAVKRDKIGLRVQMNYLYYYLFFGAGKQKGFPSQIDVHRCPVYFGYGISGGKALIQFHSERWLKMLKENEDKGCRTVTFETDHFIMNEKPDELNESLKKWLDDTIHLVQRKPLTDLQSGI